MEISSRQLTNFNRGRQVLCRLHEERHWSVPERQVHPTQSNPFTSNISNTLPRKKKYPAPFGTGHESADSFNFQNDCRKRADDGETILELPMFTDDKTWGDVGSKPGPYRYVSRLTILCIIWFFSLRWL